VFFRRFRFRFKCVNDRCSVGNVTTSRGFSRDVRSTGSCCCRTVPPATPVQYGTVVAAFRVGGRYVRVSQLHVSVASKPVSIHQTHVCCRASTNRSLITSWRNARHQSDTLVPIVDRGRPKAPLATQNASQKSSGGTKIRKLGRKNSPFVLRENKRIKPIK